MTNNQIKQPTIPGVYQHYRNKNYYRILFTTTGCDDGETSVIYQDLSGNKRWDRKIALFTALAEENKKTVLRYQPVRFIFPEHTFSVIERRSGNRTFEECIQESLNNGLLVDEIAEYYSMSPQALAYMIDQSPNMNEI